MKPFVRSPYNYDRRQASLDSALYTDFEVEPSKTVQSQRDEADINVIVKRFGLTGQLPTNVRTPLNVDFEDIFDFQSAMNVVARAQQSFSAMPADVRAEFNNDPGRFVDFCSDESNLPRMRKLGLAVPKEPVIVPTPDPVPTE